MTNDKYHEVVGINLERAEEECRYLQSLFFCNTSVFKEENNLENTSCLCKKAILSLYSKVAAKFLFCERLLGFKGRGGLRQQFICLICGVLWIFCILEGYFIC